MDLLSEGRENGVEEHLIDIESVFDLAFLGGGGVGEEDVRSELSLGVVFLWVGCQARLADELVHVYKYTFL